jgi:26S proteasome regulatory subunit N1
LVDPIPDLRKTAIEGLKTEVRSSTSSMTGVPKPFKFLRPHYQRVKDMYETYAPTDPLKASEGSTA